jgi:hypothetical protein
MSHDGILPVGAEDAPEGVSLDRYAEISANLALRSTEPRAVVLARFGLDEVRWGIAEKVWAKRIEDEVMKSSAPGLRLGASDRYPLSMRYAVTYAEASQRVSQEEGAIAPIRPTLPEGVPLEEAVSEPVS